MEPTHKMIMYVLNKSWRQHPTKKELYGNILPLSELIKEIRIIFAGYCFRSRGEIVSNIVLWKLEFRRRIIRLSAGRPNKTYLDQILNDVGRLSITY